MAEHSHFLLKYQNLYFCCCEWLFGCHHGDWDATSDAGDRGDREVYIVRRLQCFPNSHFALIPRERGVTLLEESH